MLDAPEPEGDDGATVAEQTREWKIAVEQAGNVAQLAGKLPVGVNRSLEQSEATGVDWRELLRRAWSETIPSDYSWMPPNRRHPAFAYVMLPSLFSMSLEGPEFRARRSSQRTAVRGSKHYAYTPPRGVANRPENDRKNCK